MQGIQESFQVIIIRIFREVKEDTASLKQNTLKQDAVREENNKESRKISWKLKIFLMKLRQNSIEMLRD